MIQIQQVKIPLESATKEHFIKKCAKELHIHSNEIKHIEVLKRSIDARKKPEIYYVYSFGVEVTVNEQKLLKKNEKNQRVFAYHPHEYSIAPNDGASQNRPIVIGAGPAGLFAAYLLATVGYHPIVLERGKDVTKRTQDVLNFWKTGILDPSSNVQFGEGGAGTFSDGKLNTLVKDKTGRNRFVLETFVKFGAPSEILYDNKPHIGTDLLVEVVKNMRNEIIDLGGEFHFESCVTNITTEEGNISEVIVNDSIHYSCTDVILAIGHSARDTFEMLYHNKVIMQAKEFAMGFRIEHPQTMINLSQYGVTEHKLLPAAPYKLATKLNNGRGVYSFCMCPGGYVVNSSSEENRIVVNGMSYYKRDSKNANSAIVVTVGPNEFSMDNPLGAVEYQRQIEAKAYELGQGNIPQQLYGDFLAHKVSNSYGDFDTQTRGTVTFGDLSSIFSSEINQSFAEGMKIFGHKIKGFDRYDAILSGVESRTSSPVRIERNDELQSNIGGLYPCGEGAGYAGGITSAAMDGLKIAQKIIEK